MQALNTTTGLNINYQTEKPYFNNSRSESVNDKKYINPDCKSEEAPQDINNAFDRVEHDSIQNIHHATINEAK